MPTPTMQVFDKNMRRVGTLVDSYDIQRRRRINSDYELTFMVPMTSDDYREKIAIKGHVRDERGQFYVIQSRSRSREGRKLTANIYCNHVLFKLNDYKFPYASYIAEAYGIHINQLTDLITAATGGRFKFVIHDTFDLHDVKDFGRGTCLEALNKIIQMYECEVEPDNFTINLRKKIGTDNGLQYRLKKNIVSSSFKDKGESLVTRMFAQMKDGRTFIGMDASKLTEEERSLLSGVPGTIVNGKLAVNYLISPYAQYWASDSVPFYDGEIIEQDIEEPEDLLKATRKALAEQENVTLEVTVSTADLFKIDNSEPEPHLGDAVMCIDPAMDMNKLKARITELTEYPYSRDKHSEPTISNVNLRDYADIISDLERNKNIINNLFSNGKIRTEVFESFAKQAVIDIDNSKTEIKYDQRGIVLQDQTNALNQVIMTSNGVVLTTDGGKTARTAITARGVVAEQIVGQLGNFVSLVIGSGNNVTKINTNGISAGNDDYTIAPFRVDMQGNVVARSIKLTGQIDNSEMNASDIKASTVNASTIRGSKLIGNEIEGGIITGALFRTAKEGRRIEINSTGLTAYNSSGGEAISLGQSGDGGALLFMDNGSPRGSVYGDSEGFHLGNMASIIIRSVDDATYFQGEVDFNYATVTGLDLKMQSISGLSDKLSDIDKRISEIYSELFTDMITNASFDPSSRNLKLYSAARTVATVNIPAGGSSSSSSA
ncbi:phage tail protein [Paenibacillus brasilensis]|uniref:Phage minor structural protein n=1 Tax=Paenibacillus brasilensis TaxID=128574 RepID=A0ABU0L511_9BACL|nr:phage tail spike protein [Paenibacillus brasilensis]MDQ0496388.1 phage minor structural protein [Paenibacillus brasilensis]